jgi:hypothetical protein
VEDLLHQYRTSASMVITTRLHAALTCSAMGIPVVFFFHPKDPRASSAGQIGLAIHTYFRLKPKWVKKVLVKFHLTFLWTWYESVFFVIKYTVFNKINWDPGPLHFETHKATLRAKTVEMIQSQVSRFS